jgi:hypothetical protein
MFFGVSRSCAGVSDGAAEGGHAEVGDAVAGGDLLHGLEFLLGGFEGGFQPGYLAEPAFAAGLGDAGFEVVADLGLWVPGRGPAVAAGT